MQRAAYACATLLLASLPVSLLQAQSHVGTDPASNCYGTPASGRLQNGVPLPARGANFRAYSLVGWIAGRTYVHDRVRAALLDAFVEMRRIAPDVTLVYGETGLVNGGEFRPHRTHRNGLSVDLMVPVLRGDAPATLPTHALNRYGYDVEFDRSGRSGELRIDFDRLAEWLLAIDHAGRERGAPIARVIFDPGLQPLLWKAKRGTELRRRVKFSSRPAWVRHDEHVHIDFAVPCRPL